MNSYNFLKQKKAISPIIATLLLILIAIAAGVVVYAYVVGFIGNSTTNPGATTNTLSVDQLNLASANSKVPVAVFVRNLGPSTESFNTGFYVKGSSVNNQLGIAVSILEAVAGDSITNVTLGSSTSTGLISVFMLGTCTAGHTATVQVLGTSVTTTCNASNQFWGKSVGAVTGFTFTNSSVTSKNFVATTTLASTPLSTTVPIVVGTIVTATATLNLGINLVGQLTLAGSGLQTSNPLSSGQTYTVQVTGTDSGSTTASAKSS